jgi:hypothetical protein
MRFIAGSALVAVKRRAMNRSTKVRTSLNIMIWGSYELFAGSDIGTSECKVGKFCVVIELCVVIFIT